MNHPGKKIKMRPCRLSDLPPPPPGKAGWPWTVETEPTPERLAERAWPKITIVTPSYNQVTFIEQTIRSVLLQRYPNVEYRVIDAKSTDGTANIVQKYGQWISRWSSEPDRGQVDALNRGMAEATSEIVTWLNSDDFLLPGALFSVAELYLLSQKADIISGARLQRSAKTGIESAWVPWLDKWPLISVGFAIFPQEATFFSKRIWTAIGGFDESFPYCFDGVFFSNAISHANKIVFTAAPLAVMHAHGEQKTYRDDPIRIRCEERFSDICKANVPWQYKALVRLCYTRFWIIGDALLRVAVHFRVKRKFQIGEYDWQAHKWKLVSF